MLLHHANETTEDSSPSNLDSNDGNKGKVTSLEVVIPPHKPKKVGKAIGAVALAAILGISGGVLSSMSRGKGERVSASVATTSASTIGNTSTTVAMVGAEQFKEKANPEFAVINDAAPNQDDVSKIYFNIQEFLRSGDMRFFPAIFGDNQESSDLGAAYISYAKKLNAGFQTENPVPVGHPTVQDQFSRELTGPIVPDANNPNYFDVSYLVKNWGETTHMMDVVKFAPSSVQEANGNHGADVWVIKEILSSKPVPAS